MLSSPSIVRRSVLSICALAVACAPGDDAPDTPTFAGITAEPLVSIGGSDPRPEFSFTQVPGGRFVGDDGRFVILDTQTREVRVYGGDGTRLASFGRTGTGPGEFRLPLALAPALGDSVHVWDLQLRRLTTFSVGGGGVRTNDYGGAITGVGQALANLQGILRDGSLVIRDVSGHPPDPEVPDGVHRFSVGLRVLRPSDLSPGPIVAQLPGSEVFHLEVNGRFNSVPVIWGLTSPAAALGDRIVFGSSDTLALTLVTPEGDTLATLGGPAAGRLVTQEEIDSLREASVATMDAPGYQNLPPAAIEGFVNPQKERFRAAPARDVTPVFDLLRIDSEERIWVRLVGERRSPTVRWYLYDRSGAALGGVEHPAALEWLDAKGSRVLFMARDELEVPTILVHEIEWEG